MQFRQPGILGHTESVGEVAGKQLPSPPASMAPSDYLSPIREEALQLLKADGDRGARDLVCCGRTGGGVWIGMEQ